jgi:hypothetical protein
VRKGTLLVQRVLAILRTHDDRVIADTNGEYTRIGGDYYSFERGITRFFYPDLALNAVRALVAAKCTLRPSPYASDVVGALDAFMRHGATDTALSQAMNEAAALQKRMASGGGTCT